MADTFWDPIFARLQENRDLLRLIAADLDESRLLEMIRPNPFLSRQCAPFLKGKRVTRREPIIAAILQHAAKDANLRRILLLSWVADNPVPMAFPTHPLAPETRERLEKGEFGSSAKLSILAWIEPREAARTLLTEFLAATVHPGAAAVAPAPVVDPAPPIPAPDPVPVVKPDDETLREEVRHLRKRNRDLEAEAEEWQKRLSHRGEELQLLRRQVQEAGDRAEVLSATRQTPAPAIPAPPPLSSVDAPADPPPEAPPDQAERIRFLEGVVGRKNQTIERLSQEIEQQRRVVESLPALQRQLDHLRSQVLRLEAEKPAPLVPVAGRFILPCRSGAEAHPALLVETLAGERWVVPANRVVGSPPIEGEWVLLSLDSSGDPVQVQTLERGERRECIGTLHLQGQDWFLATNGVNVPIHVPLPEATDGLPGAGVVLPEIPGRPEGIWQWRRLAMGPREAPAPRELPVESLCRQLGLLHLSLPAFQDWLRKEDIPLAISGDRLQFGGERPEALLDRIRTRLPLTWICSRPECRHQAATLPFPREARPGDLCQVCCEESPADREAATRSYDFGDLPILLIGGDVVGARYADALARHGLKIRWLSGFGSLGGLREGLGSFRGVVVVLKQVSHTLLRELERLLRKESVPVLYSPHRGISGVLRLLVGFFHPPQGGSS